MARAYFDAHTYDLRAPSGLPMKGAVRFGAFLQHGYWRYGLGEEAIHRKAGKGSDKPPVFGWLVMFSEPDDSDVDVFPMAMIHLCVLDDGTIEVGERPREI